MHPTRGVCLLLMVLTSCGTSPAGGAGPDATRDAAAGPDTLPDTAPLFEPLSCPEIDGTPESLREKADRFDALARAWHLPPGQGWWFSVFLAEDLETFEKVDMSDNVGSWTSMYAASQSFRWAVTRAPEALENLRRVVAAERDMMRITGVTGLFSRVVVNPSLPGFPTVAELTARYPDCDLSVKHCKRFNEVTEGEFAGWWFKNDVSKDEYAAHMFSMAVAWEVVDDPEVRAMVQEVVTAVGDHLVDHALSITDIDGEVTTFGAMSAVGFDDWPGFDAVLSLSWLRLAAVVGGEKYRAFYEDCLLQRSGPVACIPGEEPHPYTDYLDMVGLNNGCKTNWNNHNMAELAMYSLIRTENDPGLLDLYREALEHQLWDADDPFPMKDQEKTLFTMFYLVNMDPARPWPAEAARRALCTMKRFPASKEHRPVDTISAYETVCTERGGDPMTDQLIPIEEQVMDNYSWGSNPYEQEMEPGNPRLVESPEDYLLAYWMGRYFGFITEDM